MIYVTMFDRERLLKNIELHAIPANKYNLLCPISAASPRTKTRHSVAAFARNATTIEFTTIRRCFKSQLINSLIQKNVTKKWRSHVTQVVYELPNSILKNKPLIEFLSR